MKFNKQLTMAILAATLSTGLEPLLINNISAEETTVEKGQNHLDDAVRETKKTYRKGKKKLRDATGNGSLTEDIKDGANNIQDSVEDGAKKIKRKVD